MSIFTLNKSRNDPHNYRKHMRTVYYENVPKNYLLLNKCMVENRHTFDLFTAFDSLILFYRVNSLKCIFYMPKNLETKQKEKVYDVSS